MNSKKVILVVFILVAITQLFVPAKMILDRESILNTGKEFKFKTAPIDPSDPFRGKYITLSFDNNTIEVQNEEDWVIGETIYVLLSTDSSGFARIESVSKDKTLYSKDFLKAKVGWVNGKLLNVEYPFDRFYMEENKAHDAEIEYRESQTDTDQLTYALVSIKAGEFVLKDVLIGGVSIIDIVNTSQEN